MNWIDKSICKVTSILFINPLLADDNIMNGNFWNEFNDNDQFISNENDEKNEKNDNDEMVPPPWNNPEFFSLSTRKRWAYRILTLSLRGWVAALSTIQIHSHIYINKVTDCLFVADTFP